MQEKQIDQIISGVFVCLFFWIKKKKEKKKKKGKEKEKRKTVSFSVEFGGPQVLHLVSSIFKSNVERII